jgi:hypothetical protein
MTEGSPHRDARPALAGTAGIAPAASPPARTAAIAQVTTRAVTEIADGRTRHGWTG